jgi:hypothetical protein
MSGYVYLIGTKIFGWYKIGKSKTPEVRIRDLGILLPFKIHVYAVWKANNHDLMEKALHELYAANRINGEWFQFTKVQLSSMMRKIPTETLVTMDVERDHFSNIAEDSRQAEGAPYSGRVIGVRVEKLRGDFTPEEREAKRDAAIERKRLKRLEKAGSENINTIA